VVGYPGHVVRVDGRKPEGPDADWIHLPDPVADAIRALSRRLDALERAVAEMPGREAGDADDPSAEVRPLRPRRGPNPAGG
jgi:serine O-acetyltransferase